MPDPFPFVFECPNCGEKTKVTRTDAHDRHPDPDSRGALDVVLDPRLDEVPRRSIDLLPELHRGNELVATPEEEDDFFPFVYQCVSCGREATVTRSDAQEVSSNPDMFSAMAVLLRRRGWARRSEENALYCPDCAEDSPSHA